jgi:hypothetical protein
MACRVQRPSLVWSNARESGRCARTRFNRTEIRREGIREVGWGLGGEIASGCTGL